MVLCNVPKIGKGDFFLHIKHLPCALEDKIRTKNCLNIPFMNLLDNKTLARASLISGW